MRSRVALSVADLLDRGGDMRHCANGHELREWGRYCGYCGAPGEALLPAPENSPLAEQSTPSHHLGSAVHSAYSCPNQHPVKPGGRFCGVCGTPVAAPALGAPTTGTLSDGPARSPGVESQGSRKRARRLAGVVVGLVLVTVAVGLAINSVSSTFGSSGGTSGTGAEIPVNSRDSGVGGIPVPSNAVTRGVSTDNGGPVNFNETETVTWSIDGGSGSDNDLVRWYAKRGIDTDTDFKDWKACRYSHSSTLSSASDQLLGVASFGWIRQSSGNYDKLELHISKDPKNGTLYVDVDEMHGLSLENLTKYFAYLHCKPE